MLLTLVLLEYFLGNLRAAIDRGRRDSDVLFGVPFLGVSRFSGDSRLSLLSLGAMDFGIIVAAGPWHRRR